METNPEQLSNNLSDIQRELITNQFEQAIETFRTQVNYLLQIITLFVVADVTVVSFAISSQIASIIFISTLFPILIYYAMNQIYSISIPILYTAIYIENKFSRKQVD